MQNQMVQMEKALQERPLGLLPSNTVTNPHVELNVITTRSGLTFDGPFIPHSKFLVYREEEQESKTITKVVEIPSSHSTPLVPPPETPLSAPKPKEDLRPNPHQPPIPYPSRLENEKFQALENPTGSSGRTTSHYDHSLPDYEAFYFDVDRQKEKSSGDITSHSDPCFPKYESFYFVVDLKEFEDLLYHDPSIDPPLIVKTSDSHHEEIADELAHIISPPEYDHFYFHIEADPGELTRLLNANSSSDSVNLNKIIEDNELKSKTSKDLLTIYELNVLYLLLSISDSTISEEFSEINPSLSFPFGNENKIFNPEILMVDGIHPFKIKSPHLPNDNFKIDKHHILSEISLKIESFVSFHPWTT
ncbi:hypothetical protein Tco_0954795 [Tanacetum coccineum]|uniref:Reverse transcriptase domain-containing protein n=1 Tax=Tanacetum coccineum TaxID=301880 RepID=A0ABQ5E5E0_9ASTR